MEVKTIKVKHPEVEGAWLVVNESDADGYQPFEEQSEPEPTPATTSKAKPKAAA